VWGIVWSSDKRLDRPTNATTAAAAGEEVIDSGRLPKLPASPIARCRMAREPYTFLFRFSFTEQASANNSVRGSFALTLLGFMLVVVLGYPFQNPSTSTSTSSFELDLEQNPAF
jgi:hypothetical protein